MLSVVHLEVRVMHMSGKYSTINLHPQPNIYFLLCYPLLAFGSINSDTVLQESTCQAPSNQLNKEFQEARRELQFYPYFYLKENENLFSTWNLRHKHLYLFSLAHVKQKKWVPPKSLSINQWINWLQLKPYSEILKCWYTIQHGWFLEIGRRKEARQKRSWCVSFALWVTIPQN